ncbi:MAG: anthranilate phosphoribosyltransferase, partial [Vicinamibacterales bacterium]
AKASARALAGGSAQDNARIIDAVLDGARGAPRDIVLLNAGAALFISGAAASLEDGMRRAAEAIDRGDARRTLQQLVAISHAEAPAGGAGA